MIGERVDKQLRALGLDLDLDLDLSLAESRLYSRLATPLFVRLYWFMHGRLMRDTK